MNGIYVLSLKTEHGQVIMDGAHPATQEFEGLPVEGDVWTHGTLGQKFYVKGTSIEPDGTGSVIVVAVDE